MVGGVVCYVFMCLLFSGDIFIMLVNEWIIDLEKLKDVFNLWICMVIVNMFYNLVGKVFLWDELSIIVEFCVVWNVIIFVDEVYDSFCYVLVICIVIFSFEVWEFILIVGLVGKSFYVMGWRIGFFLGLEYFIKYVSVVYMCICYFSFSLL